MSRKKLLVILSSVLFIVCTIAISFALVGQGAHAAASPSLSAATAGPAPVCPPQIQEGSTNTAAVNLLHTALYDHYKSGDLKNGDPYTFAATSGGAFGGGFGPETRLAVLDYQSQHFLSVDGIVGPHTWHSLGEC